MVTNEMNNIDVPSETPVKDEPMYGNEPNGGTSQSWNDDQSNGNHIGQYNDNNMEHDLPPIGIKEDG